MRNWLGRLWNAIRPGRLDRDLERELLFHVNERIDELQDAGMNAETAARLAREQFGNYTAQIERTRDMDIAEGLDATLRNVRVSLRALAKSPAFSITVVLTLALGIGANSAVFSAINSVLLRPLPFPNSDRIVSIAQIQAKTPQPNIAPVRLEEWNRLNHTFDAISGYYTQDDSEASGDMPEKLTHALVSPRFLKVWGVAPQLGRDFSPREERYGGPNAVLISDGYWRRRFGASPDVIGKTLRLGIYAHMYFSRLHDSLREDFPQCAQLLGPEAFQRLAARYLVRHPSDNPSLRYHGRHFPGFVREYLREDRELRPDLAELCQLEWARIGAATPNSVALYV